LPKGFDLTVVLELNFQITSDLFRILKRKSVALLVLDIILNIPKPNIHIYRPG